MVKDEHGETMSKSKGNVIAPEDMIAEYGADAVRAVERDVIGYADGL